MTKTVGLLNSDKTNKMRNIGSDLWKVLFLPKHQHTVQAKIPHNIFKTLC